MVSAEASSNRPSVYIQGVCRPIYRWCVEAVSNSTMYRKSVRKAWGCIICATTTGTGGAWCWDPNLGPPQLFRRGCVPGLYIYSAQPGDQFLQAHASMSYAWRHWATYSLSAHPARSHSGATVTVAVHGLTLSVIWPPVLITVSDALIPERNGLSQFNEHTDKPSVPVRKFNLVTCLLVESSFKNPIPDLEMNPDRRQSSACQPSRHCDLLY